ncbi:MAG: hypothetical protein ACI8ZM_002720 [Crocinitomix sp.]|jgi:hypothetical protein
MKLGALFLILIVGFACQKEAEALTDSSEIMSDAENPVSDNPYCKIKNVNGFNIAVTYVPNRSSLTALNEDVEPDQSVHFIMEIESDGKRKTGNFLYNEVNGVGDFKDNVNYFNFSIIEDVRIAVNGIPFNVVLSNMENTYTLGNNRKIHFVAVPPTQEFEVTNIQEISFVYDDEVLGIGLTKFIFNAKDFKTIPNKI